MNYYKFKDQEKKRLEKKRIKEQNRKIIEIQKKLKPYTDLALLAMMLGRKEDE